MQKLKKYKVIDQAVGRIWGIFIGDSLFLCFTFLGKIRVRVCMSPSLTSSTRFRSSGLRGRSLGIQGGLPSQPLGIWLTGRLETALEK